jgi:TPR repeat protein
MCAEGNGVMQDDSEAAGWFLMAADQGDVEALFRLGEMHCYGIGVPRNYARATVFFQKAANQGHADARAYPY